MGWVEHNVPALKVPRLLQNSPKTLEDCFWRFCLLHQVLGHSSSVQAAATTFGQHFNVELAGLHGAVHAEASIHRLSQHSNVRLDAVLTRRTLDPSGSARHSCGWEPFSLDKQISCYLGICFCITQKVRASNNRRKKLLVAKNY